MFYAFKTSEGPHPAYGTNEKFFFYYPYYKY